MYRLLTIIFVSLSLTGYCQYTTTSIAYDQSNAVISNPERGFYHHTEVSGSNYTNLNEETLRSYRTESSITQILRVFYLGEFRERSISDEYLINMRKDFSTIRKAGVKVIVRFAYSKGTSAPYNDATPEIVNLHIQQLRNVLTENADVISVVQTGFVGTWGEWYYTDHFAGYTPSDIDEENWNDRKQVVSELLEAVPADRMIQIRTPGYKMKLLNSEEPLMPTEAFTGTDKSRIGHHNDCFVASSSDFGTYVNPTVEKPYLEAETKYLAMGGETCAVAPPYSDCTNALADLERFHWSYLNIDYNQNVLDIWREQGCFDEVERRLGYRFVMESANITNATAPSGTFECDIDLKNIGFSAPFNARSVFLVLKEINTGTEYSVQLDEDPRLWLADASYTLSAAAGIPNDMPEGTYNLFLNLPDTRLSIATNPAYSVQMANNDVWVDSLGYNYLGVQVSINNSNNDNPFAGETYFKLTANKSLIEAPTDIFGGSATTENLVFWSVVEDKLRKLERSVNNQPFEELEILPSTTGFYQDLDIQETDIYRYRYLLYDNNTQSDYSEVIELSSTLNDSINIAIDGNDLDWKNTKPILSHTDASSSSYVIRSFFDLENANFLVYGDISSYQVYMDTDNDKSTGVQSIQALLGMDYRISGGSVFEYEDNNWTFVEEVSSISNDGSITELAVSFDLLNGLNNNPNINLFASVTNNDSDSISLESARLFRTPPPDLPEDFSVSSSPDFATRLEIQWGQCTFCDGYEVEKSQDGILFQSLGTYGYSESKTFDFGTDAGEKLYYRLRAFNKLGYSDYSEVASGITGQSPLSVDELNGQNFVLIYPNPAQNWIQLSDQLDSFEIFDSRGVKMTYESTENGTINISKLSDGYYIIRGLYHGKQFSAKFIKE